MEFGSEGAATRIAGRAWRLLSNLLRKPEKEKGIFREFKQFSSHTLDKTKDRVHICGAGNVFSPLVL